MMFMPMSTPCVSTVRLPIHHSGMADPHPSSVRLHAAAAAADPSITKPIELARALGEKAQTITNWATRGVSKDGALKVQEELGISATWVLNGTPPMLISQSQTTRLDQQRLAEALVAVLKTQEALRLTFKPQAIAEALTRAYDLRSLNPRTMNRQQLDEYDRMIVEAVKQAWEVRVGEGTGEAVEGVGRGDAKAAAKRRRA